ncbi:amidase [Kribbella sp. NPDC050241]|uniref:amidase n=1 Tax=Kribbella sp. NPDC050241 TaxID=3364115 RepID=UPI00379CB46B
MTARTISAALASLRSGEVTASGLVDEAITAADAHDGELGIYLARFDEPAREAAAAADEIYAAGDPAGPLLGIPLGIKDIITTVEGPTTAQSLVHDPAWGDQLDAPVVGRLRAAGGIISGKTTTMEFATGVPDPSKPFPIPRNPWNPDHWTGGSSSGTGNGMAAGAFLGGLGTDTGGSIRIPAAFCGISGLKATFGRVPKSGCVPLGYSLDNIGPMARSARDCAIMLTVLAGCDASDPCSVDEPVPDYENALTGDLGGLRIGVDPLAEYRRADQDPRLGELLEAALAVLTARGATVVPVRLPYYRELTAATGITSRSEAFAYHAPDLRTRWSDYFAATRQGVGIAAAYTGADYVQAQRVRRVGQRELASLFTEVDLIVTPTASVEAFTIDGLSSLATERFRAMHTSYWNAVGNPALSIPMGLGVRGLPLGLQLVGRPFDEALVLRAGDAYQQATDWHLRQPALAQTSAVPVAVA